MSAVFVLQANKDLDNTACVCPRCTIALISFHCTMMTMIVARGTLVVQTFNVKVVRLTTYSFKYYSTQVGVSSPGMMRFNVTMMPLTL